MPPKNSLGKGLGAIFPDLMNELSERPAYMMCAIEELFPTKFQSRKIFNPEELRELVASIRENGIIQPLLVRKTPSGYEIIAGERRWRAAQEAGLKRVPVVLREAEDIEVAKLSLIENIQRAELNPIEEAGAYDTLSRMFGLSQEEISSRVGKDRSTIANSVRLLKLPEEIRKALSALEISAGHARALLALNSKEEQMNLFRQITKKGLNVRETESLVKRLKTSRKPAKKPAKPKRNVYLADIEDRLSARFMTKVRIQSETKGGVIEIRYLSQEDLNRLIELLLEPEES